MMSSLHHNANGAWDKAIVSPLLCEVKQENGSISSLVDIQKLSIKRPFFCFLMQEDNQERKEGEERRRGMKERRKRRMERRRRRVLIWKASW